MAKKKAALFTRRPLSRLALTLLIIVSARNTDAQTLLETARAHDPRNGPLEITVSGSTPARSVADLVPESDLVVHGLVIAAVPELNDSQTAIVTRVTVQPLRELARHRDSAVPTDARGNLTVQQLGGRLDLAGRNVIMRDSQLEPLGVGEQVVLFLKLNSEATFYNILYAPYGCLRVRNGRVEAVGVAARAIDQEVEGLDVAEVATKISEIVAIH